MKKLYQVEQNPELHEDFKKADKFILIVILFQWLLVSTFGGFFYDTYLFGFVSGGVLSLVALVSYRIYSSTSILRIINAIILLTFSIILIQQNLGRIEMHFHIFAMLSFLVAYRDIKPLTVASVYIIIHHLLFTYLQLEGLEFLGMQIIVFNYSCGYDTALLHAFFVLMEWIVLIYLVNIGIKRFAQLLDYQEKIIFLSNQSKEERDRAIQFSKAKSEFLANMSHEIRTPLNAVLGFIDLLKNESRGRKALKYVNIIDDSSQNLLKIIEDILDFSKIESGKLDIERIDFDTKTEFEVITHLFNAKCSQKNISLSLMLDVHMPPIINTDPLRVKQVIANLLSNAIKFTEEGKNIKVNIYYQNNLLNVSVQDEGKGIAEDKLKHIFELFSQEDNSTTRLYGGTGLGLTISSELVKLLGGELKVKSEVGVGSEFYFSISATIGKELKVISEDLEDTTFEGKKVLLVEDNKANQMFMKIVLESLELKFDTANDGIEAVNVFKLNKYDVILMDENMPNMNGIEATKLILEDEKRNNLTHTPIIALTANALKGDRERFLEAGMDEYLSKPVDKKKLAEILKKFI